MSCIQSSSIFRPTPVNKAIVGTTLVLTISAMALSIIGLTAPLTGPFNALVRFGATNNGILLGTSIFVLILDLAWIGGLCKRKQVPINECTSPFETLPAEISLHIFSFLSPTDLARSCIVSKAWRSFASQECLWQGLNLKMFFPNLQIIDEGVWMEYVGIQIKDIQPLNKREIIPFLKSCASLSIVKDLGITILTIPGGFTQAKLREISKKPKKGTGLSSTGYAWPELQKGKKSYRIIITNGLLKETMDLTAGEQIKFLKDKGCRLPTTLEAATLTCFTAITRGVLLLFKEREGSTRCLDNDYRTHFIYGGLYNGTRTNKSLPSIGALAVKQI